MDNIYEGSRLKSLRHLTEEEYSNKQRNNAKSKRWIPAEAERFKELYEETPLTLEEICEVLLEEYGLRNYTVSALCNKRLRMNLKLRKSMDSLRTDLNLTLLNPIFNLVEDVNSGRVILKCKKCGEVSIKMRRDIHKGCKYCIQKPSDPQEIYLIEFADFKIPSIKPGISYSYEKSRKQQFPNHKLLKLYETTYGKARKIEDVLQDLYGIYRTNPEELFDNGYTECFHPSIKEQIIKTIEEQLYG